MSQEVRNNPRRDAGGRKGGQFKEVQKEYKEELLEIARVTRVTAGGRQLRFRAAVVIGNEKGTVGLGTGKAAEVVVAIEKAFRDAKKNLITFPIAGNTLPHDVVANYKATSVMLHPAYEGTGIIAGGAIRKLMFVSGLKDVIAKRQGGGNPLTNVRATLKALSKIKSGANNPFLAKAASATEATAETAAPAKKAPAKKKSA
jgi:small subunit ribosomal protein S5